MVRVFSVYHYLGQNIHTVDDIIGASLLDNDHIILAKPNHIIEILPLQESAHDDVNHNDHQSYTIGGDSIPFDGLQFPTVDQVQQLKYCKNGNYILTIESRVGRRQSEKLFCRVYANWHTIDPACGYNTSIRARIASKVTPTNNSNCLEVIEIPLKGVPTQIACCPMTGNLAIAISSTIVFYKFIACTNDSTKYQYIDFREIPFTVQLEFIPTKIAMIEHCVCCFNHEYVNVLKIVDTNLSQSDDLISANSFTSDLSNNCAMNGGGGGSGSGGIGNKKAYGCIDMDDVRPDDWMVNITSTSERLMPRKTSLSEYRPVHIEMDCTLKRVASDKGLDLMPKNCIKDYTVKPLLRIRQRDHRDPFKCVDVKPIYMPRIEISDIDAVATLEHVLKSNNCDNFLGITILVATANDGYLYQFSNNDKWMTDDTNYIATYPFTSPAIDVAMNDYVIQVLTDRGIETYTHRIGHKLFSCSYEYNLREDLFPIEACPRADESICLIGLRPFLGVREMLCTNENLVLLANNTTSDKMDIDANWTLYNLRLPTPETLYTDFEELAKSHVRESLSTYMHLISEAHMIMRIATEFHCIRQLEQKAILGKYESIECERVYLDSCLKLGDFCVTSNTRDEYCLAFPYYTMGQISIENVFDRVLSLDDINGKRPLAGLVHTLKNMLIKFRHTAEDVGRLLTNVRSGKSVSFGEELIELFLSDAPNELSVLTLRSQYFRDYMSSKVCEAIVTKQHITDDDKLCLILAHVRNNRPTNATEIINSLNEDQLFNVLVQYWCILFDSSHVKKTGKRVTTFSELTESYLLASRTPHVQQCITNIFIYLMIQTKVLSIDLLLKLLMDYLASHVGQSGYVSAQLVLQVLLESYYYNLYVVRQYSGTVSDQSMILESMTTATTSSSSNGCGTSGGKNSHPSQQPGSSSIVVSASAAAVAIASDSCVIEHFYCESIQSEAMKILIRIYLGKLRKIQISSDETIDRDERFKFMRQNLPKIFEHHQNYNENLFYNEHQQQAPIVPVLCSATMTDRPILFLDKRSKFLNYMTPLDDLPENFDGTGCILDTGAISDVQITLIKLQALLCSTKLTRDILQEIVYFFEANTPFIGIDSFISILLPTPNCIEFFIEHYPQLLLEYAKSRIEFDRDWFDFLTSILDNKSKLIKKRSKQYYEKLLNDILQHIIANKRLAQIYKIFPVKDTSFKDSNSTSQAADDDESTCTSSSSHGIDEEILFMQYLGMAIDRDRAERLGEMIKTTGHQLYDTYNRNKQFFN